MDNKLDVLEISQITIDMIAKMDYNHLIALVRETNRAPGGYKTIASILNNAFVQPDWKILEIGTSTGVTAIEIAKVKGCHIDAIDINQRSIEEAKRRALLEGVQDKIDFSLGDAQALQFEDQTFDMVFCGNVTSLVPDRQKALNEYVRVLQDNGILAAVPMYYLKQPAEVLLNDVREAIKTDIELADRSYWISFYNRSGLMLKYVENYQFDYIPDNTLNEFIDYILGQEFLREMKPEVFAFLREKYSRYIYLFRDNLSHMGYSILLYKKEIHTSEPELFRGSIMGGN